MAPSTSRFYSLGCHQSHHDYTLCIDTFSLWREHRYDDMVSPRCYYYLTDNGRSLFPNNL
jgi:hypothetical protein